MPVNGYTVGDDVALVVQTPSGPLNIAITDFAADPQYVDLKSRPLGQPTIHGTIPDGYKGTFKADRNNPILDNYFAALEAAYYNGQNATPTMIYQTITEADGSLTQWRYTRVILKLEKAGDYSGDKKVEQTVSFMASRKIKVS